MRKLRRCFVVSSRPICFGGDARATCRDSSRALAERAAPREHGGERPTDPGRVSVSRTSRKRLRLLSLSGRHSSRVAAARRLARGRPRRPFRVRLVLRAERPGLRGVPLRERRLSRSAVLSATRRRLRLTAPRVTTCASGAAPASAGLYNGLQRLAYTVALVLALLLVLSGLAIWKPVQLYFLAASFGGYDVARAVHLGALGAMGLFTLGHVILVLSHPRSLKAMLTGGEKRDAREDARTA